MSEITHLLVLEQPWCWAVLAGKLAVANVERIPSQELVGTRIALGAERIEEVGFWLLKGLGLEVDRGAPARQLGVLGSVLLEGWVRHDGGGRVTEFYRPGSDVQFRKLKGLSGQIGWVLRQPRRLMGDPGSFRRIRARWEETTQAEREVLSYAQEHGTRGFSVEHSRRLVAAKAKAKAKE